MRAAPVLLVGSVVCAAAASAQSPTDWNAPFPAHRVMDNLYFVGTAQLGSFLITTPEGLILVNSDFESTVPSIVKSAEGLGFKFADVKILLGSHAHGDHMEGEVGNADYPQIVNDYEATFAKARTLPVDLFLGSHGSFYGLPEKYEASKNRKPGQPSPFVDHTGYLAHVATQEQRFRAMLEKQRGAAH